MTDEMKQKIADMAYNEAERLRYMNVRGLMEIAYGLASLSANWYRNNVWHDVGEDVGNNKRILVLDEEGRGCTTTREQLVRGYGEWGKGFCRWAYVEDLIPCDQGSDPVITRDGNTIYFETADGYCEPVIEELSRKFPDVDLAYAAADEAIGSWTIKGVFNNGEFKGLREHRTPAAYDIAFEMFPERKKDFRQKFDGTWEVIRDEED